MVDLENITFNELVNRILYDSAIMRWKSETDIRLFIKTLAKEYPNDADLGGLIRKIANEKE